MLLENFEKKFNFILYFIYFSSEYCGILPNCIKNLFHPKIVANDRFATNA